MPQRPATPAGGFQGKIGSLPLVDLLQVWSLNRFSGLVSVTFEGRTGHLYFVEGEIVHAEAGALAGEAAVPEIVGWPGGAFELVPNTTTLNRTIQKSVSHLLLDAHRELDETRRARPERAPAATPPPAAPSAPAASRAPQRPGVLDQIRAIRGVTQVVRFGSDGRPLGVGGAEAEALAAKALYLAVTHASAVAGAFGLHELALATLQGPREAFVVVHGSGGYLCVAVAPGVAPDAVAAQLRALLTRSTPR